MKRYYVGDVGDGLIGMVREDAGGWVSYADALAAIEQARREGREECSKELCDERDAAVYKAAHREQMVEQIRSDMRGMHAQLQKMTAERDALKAAAQAVCQANNFTEAKNAVRFLNTVLLNAAKGE